MPSSWLPGSMGHPKNHIITKKQKRRIYADTKRMNVSFRRKWMLRSKNNWPKKRLSGHLKTKKMPNSK